MIRTITNKPTANRWLAISKPNPGAKLRVFCFPYAGGGAQIYHNWQESLPRTVEVCPVQLPGRGNRMMEPAHTQLLPLVEAVGRAIAGHLDKPFVFFGHSMGAMISFELARSLRRRGGPMPLHVFASGRTAPHITDPDPPTYGLPEKEFIAELRRLNGTPQELLDHEELMQLILPLLRADFEVCQTYRLKEDEPPLECPITTYGGLRDEHITHEEFKEWGRHTRGDFLLRMFPGGHFFLHSDRQMLLQTMARELELIARKLN